ncbi:MAG: outer membrane lipoprotein carrier protein LolA [bacterium]
MIKNILITFLFLTCFLKLSFSVSNSDNKKIENLLKQIEKKMEEVKNFQAEITQTIYSNMTKETEETKGIIYFQSPDLIKIDYSIPSKEIVFLNGKTCYLYIEETNQVLKKIISDEEKSLFKEQFFFPNFDKIKKNYKIFFKDKKDKKNFNLEMVPLKSTNSFFAKIKMSVDKNSFMLTKIIIQDFFENKTTLTLSNLQPNIEISKNIFEWKIPEGASVIEQ